jgi:hypothetical protein
MAECSVLHVLQYWAAFRRTMHAKEINARMGRGVREENTREIVPS